MVAGAAFSFGWLGNELTTKTHASEEALASLASSDAVVISEQRWITFTPTSKVPKTGFIFYPCALCDARGFAPLLKEIAATGFLVVLVPMPSNFAIFDADRALEVKQTFPAIEHWVIGGHSMGGGSSAMFLHSHPDNTDGLLMWDSFTYESYNISEQSLPVLTIYGDSHHSPERPAQFEEAKQYMPPHARYQVIAGGDHFQFGHFRAEDIAHRTTATIPREQQHQQIIAHSVAFLTAIEQGTR
ncbi:hypothetical protein BST96_04260 [Oceanicoccus sagamiensis]|uniref:Alpha/beta hydrolase fold-5 domain-containing protein n=2 Tax=Oceanicoccus sagamiensis TaxID=716816 RepID=A0A1X9NAD1_9GAMM|nr:hypothetical protein BST96_04260 [Oceanicoccus sagamiensis]